MCEYYGRGLVIETRNGQLIAEWRRAHEDNESRDE